MNVFKTLKLVDFLNQNGIISIERVEIKPGWRNTSTFSNNFLTTYFARWINYIIFTDQPESRFMNLLTV